MTSYPELSRTIPWDSSVLSRPLPIGEDNREDITPRCYPKDEEGAAKTTPKRVQQHRIKGWRKNEGAISVARPHKWGNPFPTKDKNGVPIRTNEEAVRLYRQWLPGTPLCGQVSELAGHDLMCFCPLNQPCHADVLLDLANP
jgi:hypothetical protein